MYRVMLCMSRQLYSLPPMFAVFLCRRRTGIVLANAHGKSECFGERVVDSSVLQAGFSSSKQSLLGMYFC